jgi:hypothetical protein
MVTSSVISVFLGSHCLAMKAHASIRVLATHASRTQVVRCIDETQWGVEGCETTQLELHVDTSAVLRTLLGGVAVGERQHHSL